MKKNIIGKIIAFSLIFNIIPFCMPVSINAEENIYIKIDSYLQSFVENAHIPAMSVNIVSSDEALFSKSYGECKSQDTPFFLGSVSKSFTAVCIMQLVEQGKINLDSPISEYLPDATDGDNITISQLLNHSGGLGEHQTLDNYHIINKQGEHNYANVNYSILGEIIEKVSGMSYSDYIEKNVFESLQMSETSATLKGSTDNKVIDGYTNYFGMNLKRKHQYPMSENDWITVPAGYISSSANDMGRYLQMYLNGGEDIISPKSIDRMFYEDTVYVDGDVPFRYGYGIATVKEPLRVPVLRHAGLVETGTSCIFIIPSEDIAVSILVNTNDYFVTNGMVDAIGWGIILMLLGEENPNIITEQEYFLSHIRIDMIMVLVFAMSVMPLLFLPKYLKNKKKINGTKITFLILQHLVLPVFILLIVPAFFNTPLWVAKAFVPDVYITVIVSSAILFITGIIKTIAITKPDK